MSRFPYQQEGDYITLAGVTSPGLCEIKDADAPRSYDERLGYGIDGAWLFFKGLTLSKFNITLGVAPRGYGFEQYRTIWDFEQGPEWRAFSGVYRKLPTNVGAARYSLAIEHPLLNALGIRACVVLNELAWKQASPGWWVKEIRFSKWGKPKAVLNAPFAPKGRPVPTDSAALAIQKLGDAIAAEAAK